MKEQQDQRYALTIRVGQVKSLSFQYSIQSIYIKIRHQKAQSGKFQRITELNTHAKQISHSKWFQDFYINNFSIQDKVQILLVIDGKEIQSKSLRMKDYQHLVYNDTISTNLQFEGDYVKAIVSIGISLHENEDCLGAILNPLISLKQLKKQVVKLKINRLDIQMQSINAFSCLDRLSQYQPFEFMPQPFLCKNVPKK